jgi:hypothetical protein
MGYGQGGEDVRRMAVMIGALVLFAGCGDGQTRAEQTSVRGSQADTALSTELSAASAAPDVNVDNPRDVLRRYYDAIQARKYDSAYAMWSSDGQASGQTPAAFAAGFAETDRVRATVSDSIRMEGAAGSQYATVPVVIDATLKDGKTQRFEGDYTLRRAMVDGATPEQRRWHIFAAHLRQK